MQDKDYDKLACEQVGDLFELNHKSSDKIDDLIEKFSNDLKSKLEKILKPSALDLAAHAFAMIYQDAVLWLCLDGENGIEIEFSFGDDSPSIFFEFDDVLEKIQSIKPENDVMISNINKAIASLQRIRGDIEEGRL